MDEKIYSQQTISIPRYAGFWMRFWAYLLDLLVLASLNGIIVAPLLSVNGFRDGKIGFFTIETLLMTVIASLYFLFLTKKWGQTVGKRVFGLKVISQNSETLTWSALIFREVIGRYILQALFITYTLYLIIAFQKRKQGLHDMIGETYVIHE